MSVQLAQPGTGYKLIWKGGFYMFVCNIRLSSSWVKKIIVTALVLVLVIVFIIVGFRFYNSASRVMVKDDMPATNGGDYITVNTGNYTNILKDSHENVDKYVGKKIHFIGFVYKLYDFSENQFVLGREMIISSDNQAVVVGFLCENISSDINMNEFENRCWVEIEGVIRKGNYHGERPIIEVECVKKADAPCDEFVYPPDNSFIGTEI